LRVSLIAFYDRLAPLALVPVRCRVHVKRTESCDGH